MKTRRLSCFSPSFHGALMIALDDHVHALDDITLRIVLEGDDALEAQDVRPLRLGDLLDPGEEALGVHLAAAQRHRLHRHVMDRRHGAVIMVVMVVIVVMMIVIMRMVVVVVIAIRTAHVVVVIVFQEVRIVFQRAFQIEGALVEHAGEIDAGAARSCRRGRVGLMARTISSICASSSGVTRSVLLMRTTSAKAIWSSASRLSFRRSGRCLASTRATTASSSVLARTSSSMKKVWATGTGSARPVVSTMMPSKRPGTAHQAFDDADQVAAHRAADAAVVHLVDFFVGLDDQVVVDADLAEFVDDDRIFLAVVFGKDAVEQRRLAGAEITGEHGDGDGLLLRGNCVGHENLEEWACRRAGLENGRSHIRSWKRQFKGFYNVIRSHCG